MEWISSEGGPLILISKKSLADWQGVEKDDYDRACAIGDYAGVINVSSSQALVLGDEPCQSAIYLSEDLGPLIIRWQWAESENDVQKSIECLAAEAFKNPEEVIEYRVDDGSMLLFDSVVPGDAAEGLTLSLPVGTYLVTTICYAPDEETSLILHKFTPKP